jgi:hypothetical protein
MTTLAELRTRLKAITKIRDEYDHILQSLHQSETELAALSPSLVGVTDALEACSSMRELIITEWEKLVDVEHNTNSELLSSMKSVR